MRTRLEIRQRVATDTRESQINTTIEEYINQTLLEINDPAWAFEQAGIKGYNHLWSFNRRKTYISTVASTEDYILPRDVDKIGLIRQTTSPTKIRYIPDNLFYEYIPNPTATGAPKWYRLWEEEGVSVRLSVDDMVEVVSSSASDVGQTVRVTGYDSNGLLRTESISLNGTTAVSGTITFDYNATVKKPLRVSKSADTTGIITVREKTSDTTLVQLAPTERSPRFKIISFYPIPSSAISVYIEYFTRIRRLEGDNDVPDIDEKWFWLVRLGTMAKVYQYQNKESLFNTTQALYASGVRAMVKSDMQNVDYIPTLRSQLRNYNNGWLTLEDSYNITEV
jgi:hypothetical protein